MKELVIYDSEFINYNYDLWLIRNRIIDKNKRIHNINLNQIKLITFNLSKILRLRIDGKNLNKILFCFF